MIGIMAWIDRTMLTERLLGALAYVLVVTVGYFLLRQSRDHRAVSCALNVCLVALCVMAFFFVPDPSKDLYRLLEMGEIWRRFTLEEFLTGGLINTTTPLAYLYIYLCTQSGIDGLLPLISAFVFYLNVFHILKDLSRRTTISSRMLAVDYLFFMSAGAFLEVISGIRCFMALSIVARCIYDETMGRKSILWDIPWYVAACLIHLSCIPVVIIRLLFWAFLEKKQGRFQWFINGAAIVIIVGLAVTYGQTFFMLMFSKAELYLTEDSYSYIWEYLIGVLQVCLVAGVLYSMRFFERTRDMRLSNSIGFLTVFLIVNVVFIFEYNIFHRFLVVSAMLFLPTLAAFPQEETRRVRLFRRSIFWVSVLILLIACVRGNLCGYKFFLFD